MIPIKDNYKPTRLNLVFFFYLTVYQTKTKKLSLDLPNPYTTMDVTQGHRLSRVQLVWV